MGLLWLALGVVLTVLYYKYKAKIKAEEEVIVSDVKDDIAKVESKL